MWLVTNKANAEIIAAFNANVVEANFSLWLRTAENSEWQDKLDDSSFCTDLFVKEKIDERFLKLNVSTSELYSRNLVEILRLGLDCLKEQYLIYQFQNAHVRNGNYDIPAIEHPEPLRSMFSKYYYDIYFGAAWIWEDVVMKTFKREQFHTNFKTENRLTACPFCDIDTIAASRNATIEHFMPRNKYPYLSCNEMNLLSTCTSCNLPGTGKGMDYALPMVSPYSQQIGDAVVFGFENGTITIDAQNVEAVDNFVELLKLRSRYNSEHVKNGILAVLRQNVNLFRQAKQMGVFGVAEMEAYLLDVGRYRGYYFVQSDLLQNGLFGNAG